MKKVYLLIFIIPMICLSQNQDELQKTRAVFNRYFKSAHPIPDKDVIKKAPIFLSQESRLPKFLNVNTTSDELSSEPNKMQNESSISVNPTDSQNLIASAVDYRANSSTWVYVSSDGGSSWRNLNLGKPYPNWRSTNDPSVMFDGEGIGYLCYGGFGDVENSSAGLVGENGVFIAKTTDKGITWKAHIPVIIHLGNQTLDSTFEDKYYVQVDNSKSSPYYRHVYVPWKRVTPRDSATQIVISKSVDFGETWSKPVNISNRLSGSSEDTTFGQSFPLALTGPEGELYVVWNHGIEHGVGFAKSLDGGATFTSPKVVHKYNIFGETKMLIGQGFRHVVKGTVRAEAYPSAVCDITDGPNRGNIYLTWSADNYPNVYFSKSTDKGESWSKPIIIHSDTTNDQFWHWLSIDPTTGDLGVMFLDSRNDPANIMVECFVAYSSDGGDTWIDRRISDINSDLRLNPFQGNNFAGDYSGNAFYDGIIYPSWVDMRNAVTNIADSDVFTAIVNTRAPEPPEEFKGISDLNNPIDLNLSWIPPTKRAFGQELQNDEYELKIFKNNEFFKTLPGGSEQIIDNDVISFEKYDYRIFAQSGKDFSISREITVYPGGSKQPDIPDIVKSSGNYTNDILLDVKLPGKRSDKITPLVNLQGLELFRNGVLTKTVPLNSMDTGKVSQFIDNSGRIGFFNYKVRVFDFFEKLKVNTSSEFSAEVNIFTGSYLDNLQENFDNLSLADYYITNNWETTDEVAVSGKFSFTNAKNRKYIGNQFDTLVFLPIKQIENEDLYMTFMQICAVFPDDSSLIEISYDNMESWSVLANFNQSLFEEWRDTQLSNSDWKFTRLTIPYNKNSDRVFVRARFRSNVLRHGDGWYLDDVVIGPKTLSVEATNNDDFVSLLPNPANDYIKLISKNDFINSVRVIDMLGNTAVELTADNVSDMTVYLRDCASGIYFVEIINSKNIISRKLLLLRK